MATKKGQPEMNLSEVAVNIQNAEKAKYAYRALLHPLRSKLLAVLDKSKNKRKTVTDIYNELKLEQSVASQHLAILRRANLVKSVREGKRILYSVNYDALRTLNKASELLLSK